MTHASARHASLAEINITPLIDVMLVLLIIFMVTAPVLARRIDLDINGDGKTPPATPQSLVVRADGSVRWDGVVLPADAIAEQMRVAARAVPPAVLRIEAETGVRFASVAPVLAEARASGIEGIDVALDAR